MNGLLFLIVLNMTIVSFFNPKGGVGKSLHTVLFASWLAYGEGARVKVVDCENEQRLVRQRNDELRAMSDPESPLARFLSGNPVRYPLYEIERMDEAVDGYSSAYLDELNLKHWAMKSRDDAKYDYVLYDFPATFMNDSPAFKFISSGLVDFVAVPIDTNADTRKEALIAADMMRRNEAECVLFWNNVSVDEVKREGFLESGEELYRRYGFEVMPQRVRSFVKARRESDDRLFVKSTVCWPERYVRLSCPYVVDFYKALKERVDRL